VRKKLDKRNRSLVSSRQLRLAERGHVSLTLTIPEQAREPLRLLAQRLRAGEALADILSTMLSERVSAPLRTEEDQGVEHSAQGAGTSADPAGESAAAPIEGQSPEGQLGKAQAPQEQRTDQGTDLAVQISRQREEMAHLEAETSRLKHALDETQTERREADARAQAQSRRADELIEKLDRAQAALMQARNAAREDRHYLLDIRMLPGWLRWWVERYR
jgi:molecular chaperone GrpE (heat shock protein)